jgi:hypothetical protein
MKTIAEQIKWDFETNGNLVIRDKNSNQIYYENSDGDWEKKEYDSQGNQIYFKNSNGFWGKSVYDSKSKLIYSENSNGRWTKHEYDSQGNEIYWENSSGTIIDNRPKTCSDKEIVIEGVKYKLTKV